MPEGVAAAAAIEQVRAQARQCTRCPLFEIGAQTVFGDGPVDAALMFVGEAPGAREDQAGLPFVGPAGMVFDEALRLAGIDRSATYVTNAVKHRPSVRSESGRRRNRAPKQSEIRACAVWLDREIEIVRPEIICCLGAVAARRMLGKDFKLMDRHGSWFTDEGGHDVLATVHPSFVMIQRSDTRERWMETFVNDLREVKRRLDRGKDPR